MENSEDGNPDYEAWRISVRDNFQNFVRAINKQFVYSAESTMWTFPIEVSEPNDLWAISVMEKIMENEVMKAHCQGFYRDTVKNMSHYTKEYAESKKQFILNQLKGWFDGEVWQSFEKKI